MFKNKLKATLGKVNKFIKDLEVGVEQSTLEKENLESQVAVLEQDIALGKNLLNNLKKLKGE